MRLELRTVVVSLEGQLDQTIEELRVRESRRFPEFRVHRDARETGQAVQLVHVDLVGLLVDEEVDARHALCVEGLVGELGRFPDRFREIGIERCGDDQLGRIVSIFGVVVVERLGRANLADDAGFRMVVAEDRDLDLACDHARLDHDLAVIASRFGDGGDDRRGVLCAGDADRRAGVGRLHVDRQPELGLDALGGGGQPVPVEFGR